MGVLELEARALADHDGAGLEGAHHGRQRGADVAGHHVRQAGRGVDRSQETHGGRLAVGAGHGQKAVRQEPPGQLQLAGHLQPALARGVHDRGVAGHAGALHHGGHAVELRQPVAAQVHLHPVDLRLGLPGVDTDHLAVLAKDAGHGPPGARQPHHQVGPGRQGRSHVMDAW
jgi:hypothetical protein